MYEIEHQSEPSFVGRDGELRQLEAAVRAARARRPRPTLVVGEPGVGKTRLVEEFVQRSDVPADRVLWGRCPEQSGAPAYWPWTRLLRDLVEAWDADTLRAALGGDAALIASLVPAVHDRLPDVVPAPPLDHERARFQLFDAVARVLRRAAAEHPLVAVLDDLHWADESSLLLLAFVAQELRGAQLVIVGTLRDQGARRTPRPLGELARVAQRVVLRGLDRDAVRVFVASRGGAPPALVDRLHELTEGNPFFLDEVLRELHATGEAAGTAKDAFAGRLPASVRDAIRNRLDALAADEQRLLATASVIGRDFAIPLLQGACGLPLPAVLDGLSAAVAAGVVATDDAPDRYRFTHALLRETLYADLLPSERARLHGCVGQAMETLHAAAPDAVLSELSLHFYHAAPLAGPEHAAEWARRAGRQAVKQLAYDEAVLHYERALSAMSLHGAADGDRVPVLLALANAARAADRDVRARDAFAHAARLAARLGDGVAGVQAAVGYALSRGLFGGVDALAVDLLERAWATLPEGDSMAHVSVMGTLVEATYFTRDEARREAFSREALAMARRLDDPRTLGMALVSRQLALLGIGDLDERLALADESIRVAGGVGFRGALHRGRVCRVHVLLERGDTAEAARELERLAEEANENRRSYQRWQAAIPRATLALLQGRFDDAARLAAEATAVRNDVRDEAIAHVFCVQTLFARMETGQAASLEPTVRGLADGFPGIPTWRALLALLLVDGGRHAEAGALFDGVAAQGFDDLPRDALYLAALAACALLAVGFGDRGRAARLFDLLRPFAGRVIVVAPFAPVCLGSVDRFLALLALVLERHDEAVHWFESALATHLRMNSPPLVAHVQHEYARLLLAGGDAAAIRRGQELAEAARATATALGMRPLLERLAALEVPAAVAAPAAATPRATGAAAVAPEPPRAATIDADAVLRREGDYWTIGLGAAACRLKDAKGFGFLATLLRHPGHEFHVLDLVQEGVSLPPAAAPAAAAVAGLSVGDLGDAGELLDPAARAAYRRRLEDLHAELEEAEAFNDPGRAERARREVDFLAAELARGVGLGGRNRKAAAAAERARQNLSRTIGAAVKRIGAAHPLLGEHLAATVRTGLFCSYQPDPRARIRWTV